MHSLHEEEDHQVSGHWAPMRVARHVQPLLAAALRAAWITAVLETAVLTLPCDFRGGTYHAGWDGSKEIRQWSYKGLVAYKTCFSVLFFHQGDNSQYLEVMHMPKSLQ